jgi:hypothetical protein
MAKLQYLGTTVANQHRIQEKIKGRSNSENACYRSVQDIYLSHCQLKTP